MLLTVEQELAVSLDIDEVSDEFKDYLVWRVKYSL